MPSNSRIPGIILGAGVITVNKTEKPPVLVELIYITDGEIAKNKNYTKDVIISAVTSATK